MSASLARYSVNSSSTFELVSGVSHLLSSFGGRKGGAPPVAYHLSAVVVEMLHWQRRPIASHRMPCSNCLWGGYSSRAPQIALFHQRQALIKRQSVVQVLEVLRHPGQPSQQVSNDIFLFVNELLGCQGPINAAGKRLKRLQGCDCFSPTRRNRSMAACASFALGSCSRRLLLTRGRSMRPRREIPKDNAWEAQHRCSRATGNTTPPANELQ